MTHRNFKQSLTTPEKERTELREQKCSEMQSTEIDFKITQDTSTHTNQMPSSWLFYGDDPLILSACEPFLSLLLLRPIFGLLWSRPAELPLVANVVRYSALWIWLPLWILLAAALHPALCPLILPWSCLARHLVLFLPGPGLCCRSFLPSVVI